MLAKKGCQHLLHPTVYIPTSTNNNISSGSLSVLIISISACAEDNVHDFSLGILSKSLKGAQPISFAIATNRQCTEYMP